MPPLRNSSDPTREQQSRACTEQSSETGNMVNIGVIVTIAGPPHTESDGVKGAPRKRIENAKATSLLMGSPAASCDVLGQSITDRVVARLRGFGAQRISIISEGKLAACTATSANASLYRAGSTPGFWPAWDSVVSDYLAQGIETLLWCGWAHTSSSICWSCCVFIVRVQARSPRYTRGKTRLTGSG